MKKIVTFSVVTFLSLASCEKSKIILPSSVSLHKTSQNDTLKVINNDTDPPIIPVTGGGPR